MRPRRFPLELSDITVSVLEWTPSSPPLSDILLLHGGGSDNADLSWGEVGPALAAAGHRVFAPDHPGFGKSAPAPWRLTQERLVQYVGEIVDALNLDDYVIGGISLGGGMTIGHLVDRPNHARGAVLLGSYGVMPHLGTGVLGIFAQLTSFALVRTGALSAITRTYARSSRAMEPALRSLVRDPASRTPELVEAVLVESASGNGLRAFSEWQLDQVLWNRLRTDYRTVLSSIRTPTLLIHGDHDSGVPIERARAAAAMLPHGDLLTVPGAGHWVQRDSPGTVIPGILEFVKRASRA